MLHVGLLFFSLTSLSQWVAVSNGLEDDKSVFYFASSGNHLYAGVYQANSSEEDGVYFSTDNGETWDHSAQIQNEPYGIAAEGNYVYAPTMYKVWISSDYGNSWDLPEDMYPYFLGSIGLCGGSILVQSGFGGIAHSENHGSEWNYYPFEFDSTTITGFASNGTYLFAGTHKTMSTYKGKILRSGDCGISWTELLSFNDDYIQSIAVSGNHVYAGTRMGGILVSHDNGNTWSEKELNLFSVSAIAAEGAEVFAGAEGVNYSPDYGETWFVINDGFVPWPPRPYALIIHNDYLFVGTLGESSTFEPVWRRSIAEITGMEKHKLVNAVFYPNPASDYLVFSSDLFENMRSVEVKFYNLSGNLVLSETLDVNQNKLHLTKIPAGLYFVEIKHYNQSQRHKLIVVN